MVTYVLQPADALLLFNRHPGGIDLPLQSICAVELVAAPELDRRQPQRLPRLRNHQAGVHQNTATGVKPGTARARRAGLGLHHDSDRLGVFMPVGQFRRVMQNQNR